MAFFVADFFRFGQYDAISEFFSAIYIVVLGIYASTKEFERWHGRHFSRYLGEYFTIFWTALAIIFLAAIIFTNQTYHLPDNFLTVYISVLGIFALTQKSKNWYKQKNK